MKVNSILPPNIEDKIEGEKKNQGIFIDKRVTNEKKSHKIHVQPFFFCKENLSQSFIGEKLNFFFILIKYV